ncbi:MAG: hypothetical protein AB7N76_07425 [Planctomycetota bacterium]
MIPLLRPLAVVALLLAALFPSTAHAQYFDDSNGLWAVKLDGKSQSKKALTESYEDGGDVTLRLNGKVVTLTRVGNTLTSATTANNTGIVGNINDPDAKPTAAAKADVTLELKGLDTKDPADDTLEGTFFGKKAVLRRDVASHRAIVVKLPGDRPWVRFMREILIPKTAEDRETYHTFRQSPARSWLQSCQLYQSDYWQRKYMKGGASAEGNQSFDNVIVGLDNYRVSPRSITMSKFGWLLQDNMADSAKSSFALARSGLGMYFGTAAGGSVRIPVTDNKDCTIYYITDRRANSRNGLVVMDTPEHPPLASSFGKWLLSFSKMDYKDDMAFAQCLFETLVKSSSKSANSLKSAAGRTAYTDYLGVMAIEDQRGVMFANDDLSWGYNMTSGSFTALISRALSHGQSRKGPDLVALQGDSTKNKNLAKRLELDGRPELATQVIVADWNGEPTLRPGDCSYFDTLNGADDVLAGEGTRGGDDFQEGEGMELLRRLTTKWLREKHAALVKEAEDSVAMFIPADELSSNAKEDVFHCLCENFYNNEKFSQVTPAQADRIVKAGMALMKVINDESRDLETFILQNGVKKSQDWAPRASGF